MMNIFDLDMFIVRQYESITIGILLGLFDMICVLVMILAVISTIGFVYYLIGHTLYWIYTTIKGWIK